MTTQHLEEQITESPPEPGLVLSEDDDFPLYDARQTASFFGMKREWVLKEAREGRIAYVEVGNKYKFKPRHIREAIAQREVDPSKRGRNTASAAA